MWRALTVISFLAIPSVSAKESLPVVPPKCESESSAFTFAKSVANKYEGTVSVLNKEEAIIVDKKINSALDTTKDNEKDAKEFIGILAIELPKFDKVFFAWIHIKVGVCKWVLIPMDGWKTLYNPDNSPSSEVPYKAHILPYKGGVAI